jgi:hypothetical protein
MEEGLIELIMSGNPNLNTIKSVTYFANRKYSNENKKIEKVFFIDTSNSLHDKKNEDIELKRIEFVRNCIEESIYIQSKKIDVNEFHKIIPKIISDQLKSYSKNDIIVDLTNGNKYISGTLYASASMSKIKNLFFLSIPYNITEELNDSKYEDTVELIKRLEQIYDEKYISIYSPLEGIENLEKYNHFEIVYYEEEAKRLSNTFKDFCLNDYFKETFESNLTAATDTYFNGRYGDTIRSLGVIVEHLDKEISEKLTTLEDSNLNENPSENKSAGSTKKPKNNSESPVPRFCNGINNKIRKNQSLNDVEEELQSLRGLDCIIKLIRFYRNDNSHSNLIIQTPQNNKEEAKLVLNNTFYLLDSLSKSSIFK